MERAQAVIEKRMRDYAQLCAHAETVAALTQAAGFIRRELGARMKLRQLPQLKFTLDHSIEYSVRIAGILQELARERPEE